MDDVSVSIEAVERLVRVGTSVDDFVPEIRRLLSLSPNSLGSDHDPGLQLYRATNHHRAIPTLIEELWFPPPEKAALARANRQGNPIFYCSSDPKCALRELSATAGQVVVLAKWVTTSPMLVHDLGYASSVFARAGAKRHIPDGHRSFHESKLDDNARTIRDYIALSFTEPTSTKYALTAAIAELHLASDEFAGLKYPSVSRAANVDNLALRPEFVRTGLRLETAEVLKVSEIHANGSVKSLIVAELSSVEAGGILKWKVLGDAPKIPPGGSYGLRVGTRTYIHGQGVVEVGGHRYSVEPGYMIEVTMAGITIYDLQGKIVEPLPQE